MRRQKRVAMAMKILMCVGIGQHSTVAMGVLLALRCHLLPFAPLLRSRWTLPAPLFLFYSKKSVGVFFCAWDRKNHALHCSPTPHPN